MPGKLFVCIIFLASYIEIHCFPSIDPPKCKIYGPGIENSKLNTPVRYFFVSLVGNDGQKLNSSAGNAFLMIDNLDQAACSIWWKVLDRHDGSYVVRYKLIKQCSHLKLAITTPEGVHLGKSPYTLKGPLYPESCSCPISLPEWLDSTSCMGKWQQLQDDLSSWSKRTVNFSWVLEEASARWGAHPGAYSYCHYVIVDNQISRKCFGQHVGFKMFSDAILLSLIRKVRLSNVQFLMNLGDWPLEKRERGQYVPMFSWCGWTGTKDIVLPTYELTESTLEMMGRQSLDIFSAQEFGTKIAWNEKVDKGFWRGRDSSKERLKLVALSRNHPDLLDAGITRFFFFRNQMDEYGPEVPHVTFEQFFKYKYQITLDGTVAAYRLPYLLAGNGLVFKQDSSYYEHFYHLMQPWKHYVPIKRDLSDLMEKLEWARDHDQEAQKISHRAQMFVRKYLDPKQILCYYVQAIEEFSSRLDMPPTQLPIDDGYERVEQPDEASACQCEMGVQESSQSDQDVLNKPSSGREIAKDEL